jgi:hypothetical protein
MESVSTTATHTIKQMLERRPLTAAKVVFAWRFAAGPALARSASAEWSADGTLILKARGAWQREIERAIPVLKDRLAFLLGHQVVRKIVVTTSSQVPSL